MTYLRKMGGHARSIAGTAALGVALVLAPAARAAVGAPHVTVDLVADAAAIQPGHDLAAGVRFVLEDGWHVYWQNPGDSGEAPHVEWTLPAGVTAGPLEWPVPSKIAVGPLANYGYEHAVLLASVLGVPAALDGASVTLAARVAWLVCNADECIPGRAPLTLELPVRASPPPASADAGAFAATRARVPIPAPRDWTISLDAAGDTLGLVVHAPGVPLDPAPRFFPFDRERIEHAAPERVVPVDGGFRLELARAVQATTPARSLDGVLVAGGRGYVVTASSGTALGRAAAPLALAFAGGLLLNLMPCVFPVLALKAFGLLHLAGAARARARRHGVLYAAGVLVSFWAFAGVILAARAAGTPLGWGFQLQSPVVVAALAGLFFWMALVLLGVTTVGGSIMGVGSRVADGGGARGAFASGVLATVVATPCTAPFMATALGYALVAPPAAALGVFTAMAIGLALPYVVVTLVPAIGRRLPRPGPWMETLKELLAFPLLATVVWLTWVASRQGGPGAVVTILAALLLLGFAAWVAARMPGRVSRAVAAACVAGAVALGASVRTVAREPAHSSAVAWVPYSAAGVDAHLHAGTPVFVDFTAAWCVTCQVNERLALDTAAVAAKLREKGVVPMRADWTQPDPDITRALERFGRDGVPLYLLYTGRDGEPPRILPQLLTPGIVIDELDELDTRSPT